MLGKLDLSAIPLDEPIPLVAALVVFLAAVGVLGWVTIRD